MPAFKTPKSQQTFERVLDCAGQLFLERGYEQTTLRDISAASKLGLGALYYYFSSKEEVVQTFYLRIQDQVCQEFRQSRPPADLPLAFAHLMNIKLAALEPHRHLLRIVLKEAVDPQSPLCPLHPASRAPLEQSVKLFAEIAAGDQTMARGLWSLHMAVLGYWLHDRSAGFGSTHKLVEIVSAMLRWSGRLAKIPGFGGLRAQLLGLIGNLFEHQGG